jgi:hypothetical protein
MPSLRCAVVDCPHASQRQCGRCRRSYCERHTRWRAHAVERGRRWEEAAMLVCYDCMPATVSE